MLSETIQISPLWPAFAVFTAFTGLIMYSAFSARFQIIIGFFLAGIAGVMLGYAWRMAQGF